MADPEPNTASSALRARLEGRATPEGDASQVVSILEIIHKLKDQIQSKDRIIREKTAELLATRDYLKRIFGALADAVLVINPEGLIESANQAASEMLDRPVKELIGAPAASLWAVPEQAAQFSGQGLSEQFERGASRRSDMLIRTSSGREIPVSWSSAVLTIDGKPSGLVGIARDVRVDRRLEDDKLRAVQALAASVAHEIRNPLGAIQNSVALLLRDLKLEGEDQTLLGIVMDETERISQIVDQFLTFARPLRAQFREADLGVLLRDIVTLAEQDERAQSGCELMLHLDAQLPSVTFDPSQIKQVIWNLVSNALDAAATSIAIRARPTASDGVEVRVADDGDGMPPEALARATEPFHTTKAQGTGLGLAISKRIIEHHGGTLQLGSVVGSGTTVSFILPRTLNT